MEISFCPQCGTKTILREDGGRARDACPSCDWIHYADTAVGVGALILRDGHVLLVERGIPPVGLWTLPSGWIEQEDTIATAVVREVKEETGLDCTIDGMICIRNLAKPLRNEMYICFLCNVDPLAEPVPDGVESTQACFVHPDRLELLHVSPFTRHIITHYLQNAVEPWTPCDGIDIYDSMPGAAIFAAF